MDRPVPDELRKNSILWGRYCITYYVTLAIPLGEGVSGALHWKDLVKIAAEVGFAPPVIVSAKTIATCGKGLEAVIGIWDNITVISSVTFIAQMQ